MKLKLSINAGREKLFLRDPSTDFLVLLGDKIFPLHKLFLGDSQYFMNQISKDQKVHIIDQNLDEQILTKILGVLYGIQVEFQRNSELKQALDVIIFLQIRPLQDQVRLDMVRHLDEYDFFIAMQIARHAGYMEVEVLCWDALAAESYQQMNYNKYDLFQCTEELFKEIIKQYHMGYIKGKYFNFNGEQLRNLVKEYSQVNGVYISPVEIFNSSGFMRIRSLAKQSKLDSLQTIEDSFNSEQKLLDNSFEQSLEAKEESASTFNQSYHKQTKISNFEQKRQQILKLKQINSLIQKTSQKMFTEIKSAKKTFYCEQRQQSSAKLNSLSKKMSEYQVKNKEHSLKCSQLQLKLNTMKNKDNESSKYSKNSQCTFSEKSVGSWEQNYYFMEQIQSPGRRARKNSVQVISQQMPMLQRINFDQF